MIIILVGLKKYIPLRKQHREIRDDFVKFQDNRRQNVEAIARHDVRGLAGKAHGKSPFSCPWSSAEQRGAIASELSPTTRTSCAVIYRPYLRPANCLFKHNKTAVPPFNLRRALFRVRTPFRFPLVLPSSLLPPPHTPSINVSSFLFSALCDMLYPHRPLLLPRYSFFCARPSCLRPIDDSSLLYPTTRTRDSSKKHRLYITRCN